MILGCTEKLVQKHIPNPVALRTLKQNSVPQTTTRSALPHLHMDYGFPVQPTSNSEAGHIYSLYSLSVITGVPQGSVLSPLFYTFYIHPTSTHHNIQTNKPLLCFPQHYCSY